MLKKYINLKGKKGITLVALVVTIVILLILAGISINLTLGQNGILQRASKTKEASIVAKEKESLGLAMGACKTNYPLKDTVTAEDLQEELQNEKVDATVEQSGSNLVVTYTATEHQYTIGQDGTVETAEPFVPNYADIDDDGTVDGIIYADLITGATGDGQWTNSDGDYTIPKMDSSKAKKYYVSQETYEGQFGTGKVIAPIAGTTGEDRFYAMALKDIDGKVNGTYYNWYYSAYDKMSDYETYTSRDFGKGKENTDKMIKKWNDQGETKQYPPYYGAKNEGGTHKDLWGEITAEVSKGWYVPSRAEWAAFSKELKISKTKYAKFGLSDCYWSSSQSYPRDAWGAYFNFGHMGNSIVYVGNYVRLGTTF